MPSNDRKAERAKLFMPFDALTGYRQAIQEKERITVKRKQLSEDDYHVLNEKLLTLHRGDMVRIVHYHQQAYVETTGLISKLDFDVGKYIQVVNQRIAISDVIEIDTENI